MPIEDYVLLAPGLIAGRLSVEPWLGILGLAIGVWVRPSWLVATIAATSGAAWGAISFFLARDAAGGPLVEWVYLAALPVVAAALLSHVVMLAIRTQRAPN